MASTPVPMTFAQGIVLASGTSVGPTGTGGAAAPVPDNCHTVMVTNPDTTGALTGLVGIGTAGGALTAGTTAQRIPSGTTRVLELGPVGNRAIMDQAQVAGSGLIFDSIGGALTLEITYLNTLRPGGFP